MSKMLRFYRWDGITEPQIELPGQVTKGSEVAKIYGTLTAIGKNLRTLARQGQVGYIEAAKRIMFLDQSIEGALDLLLEQFERSPSQPLLEAIGDFYVNLGSQVVAQNIFKSMYYENSAIHVTNLIHAGVPATRALVDDKKKILFIPIPKCGSSTIKNYFTSAIFGETYGETVHFKHPEIYRTVSATEIDTKYRDYYRFSAVRDPMSRLVSYYVRNVVGGSLRREAHGRETFLDFPTRPGPKQFAFGFHHYRQLFKDFRHHTDPVCRYLDPFRSHLDKIYQMSEIEYLRMKMSEIYGCELKDDRAMISRQDDRLKSECAEASKALAGWYQRDYEGYF